MADIVKRIVCLANSRKGGDRCVAGREILASGRPGPWVRPVSSRPNDAVSEQERQYRDGSEPRVLDVVDVPVIKASPQEYQRENWLLDPERRWELIRRLAPSDLAHFTTREAQLWVNGHSSAEGENDRIPSSIAIKLPSSLRLIRVDRMELSVRTDPYRSRRFVRGRFRHAQTDYSLRITDPVCEELCMQQENGDYPVGESYLTVSLGEPYEGYSYKLIAAVIEPNIEWSLE